MDGIGIGVSVIAFIVIVSVLWYCEWWCHDVRRRADRQDDLASWRQLQEDGLV